MAKITKYKSVLQIILLSIGLFGFYSCEQNQSVNLKIMTYNIRHGEGMDMILDLSRAVKVINSQDPDLCGLQELDNYCMRSDSIGQTEYLAENVHMKGTFGKFMDFQKGEYGMATLTSKPLISTKVLQLPDGKYESRTSIVHEVQISDDCIIAFANVHFDWINDNEGSNNRMNQAKVLVKYINDLDRASIIVGDFNCSPDSPTMKYFDSQDFTFIQKGKDNLSFQGKNKGEIDHVIYRNTDNVKFEKKSIQLLDIPIVSDHRPLVVELDVSF